MDVLDLDWSRPSRPPTLVKTLINVGGETISEFGSWKRPRSRRSLGMIIWEKSSLQTVHYLSRTVTPTLNCSFLKQHLILMSVQFSQALWSSVFTLIIRGLLYHFNELFFSYDLFTLVHNNVQYFVQYQKDLINYNRLFLFLIKFIFVKRHHHRNHIKI